MKQTDIRPDRRRRKHWDKYVWRNEDNEKSEQRLTNSSQTNNPKHSQRTRLGDTTILNNSTNLLISDRMGKLKVCITLQLIRLNSSILFTGNITIYRINSSYATETFPSIFLTVYSKPTKHWEARWLKSQQECGMAQILPKKYLPSNRILVWNSPRHNISNQSLTIRPFQTKSVLTYPF